MSESWTSERARVASLTRSRAADDPDLIEARQKMRLYKLVDHVRRVVDEAPPLTADQRATLAALLVGGAR